MTLKNSDLNIFFTRGGTVPRLDNWHSSSGEESSTVNSSRHVMDMYCILGKTIFQNLTF